MTSSVSAGSAIGTGVFASSPNALKSSSRVLRAAAAEPSRSRAIVSKSRYVNGAGVATPFDFALTCSSVNVMMGVLRE